MRPDGALMGPPLYFVLIILSCVSVTLLISIVGDIEESLHIRFNQ